MKRFAIAFAGVFLALMIAGCGGGLEEGAPKDGPTGSAAPRLQGIHEAERR